MSISVAVVFIQGLVSFFSPCVLPLLPLYIGYLSGGALQKDEAGQFYYDRKKTALHTVFFVIGISFAFFALGLGMSALGQFFRTRQFLIARIGGILVIFFGLYQLGVFKRQYALETERHLPVRFEKAAMSPVTALLMGFVFSFAWTPCVGPALASVLLMTASAPSRAEGLLLIGVYTLGFILPFLAVGFFAASLLSLFQKHRNIVKYTVKIGGILLIILGLLMVTGRMNTVSGMLAGLSGNETVAEESASADETEEEPDITVYPAPDFILEDQYGELHTMRDYRGKVVFLNVWATWCPPCRSEMPDIQKLYEKYNTEDSEVAVLGLAFPGYGSEQDTAGVAAFLEENGYTYPVLMDEEAELMYDLGITAYPTTFMIDKDGNIFGYVTGAIPESIMEDIIRQTLSGVRD